MPLGKAHILVAVTVVAIIVGFVIPEMYAGVSDVDENLESGSFLKGLPMAIIGLSMIAVFVVISVVILEVVKFA